MGKNAGKFITFASVLTLILLIVMLVRFKSSPSDGEGEGLNEEDPFIDPVMAIEEIDHENNKVSTDRSKQGELP